jgi:opacity protein-like surface antigen
MRLTALGNSAMRNAIALAIAAATAGCASNPGSYNPAEIAQESHIYAGGAIGKSSTDDDVSAIDRTVIDSLGPTTLISNTSTLDDSDLAFGAVLGYRIAPFFGVEAGYYRLGKEKYNGVATIDDGDGSGPSPFTTKLDIRTTGLGISGLAFLPLKQNYELYARGGLLLANTNFDVSQSFQGQSQRGSSSNNSTDFFVGAGFSYYYQDQIDFRVEYQRFLDVGNSDTGEVNVDLIGLQVMYSIF